MGFPSPATDYVERNLSLDSRCNMRSPSVFLFKASTDSLTSGIKKNAILVIDRALKPMDGSIIAADILGEFKLVRVRLYPHPHLEELERPERRISLRENELLEGEGSLCFGVVTHCLNGMRDGEFDEGPFPMD